MVNDTTVSVLSKLIFEQEPDINASTTYQENPAPTPDPHNDDLCQRLRLNLIYHRGVVCDIITVKLFHSFRMALRDADSLLVFLPFQSSKQHNSPLMTQKQILNTKDNQIYQFYKPFYHKQIYLLSGYFHISTQLTYSELISLPKVQQWLDSNCYFLKLGPSQEEEMIPLGHSVTVTFYFTVNI